MKIHFTKKEYHLLLHVLYISEWVMNAYETEDNAISEPYRKLEQKLMACAKDFGCESLVEYSADSDTYYPTRELEEEGPAMDFISEFEENVFWEKLSQRLAHRDYYEEAGFDKVKDMDPLKLMAEEDKIADKYFEEFEKNGLKNLRLAK